MVKKHKHKWGKWKWVSCLAPAYHNIFKPLRKVRKCRCGEEDHKYAKP